MAIIFKTQRLIVREFTPNDAKQVYEYSQESSLKEGLPNYVYAGEEEARMMIDFVIQNYSTDLDKITFPYVLGVTLKDDEHLIGHVALSILPEEFEDEIVEIIFSIGEEYQNKGYATEAVKGMAEWAKENLNLDQIYALILTDNSASCKVLEKAEFVYKKGGDKKQEGAISYYKVYCS